MATTIKLPQYAWYDPREVEFPFPDGWQVEVHNIAGYNTPAMTPTEIRASIASPIGMPPIKEMARGRNEVVIVFDDMTRSTQVSKIVPFVLEDLTEAGIPDNNIRFIAAVGNHEALDRVSLAKKLGEDVLVRFRVYNHCPFINCTYVGTTSYGTAASVNAEVMSCDLKIGIGQITPHISQGFSGGGKIIMPGVASYDTVETHHGKTHATWKAEHKQLGRPLMGVVDENPSNADIQEIARLAGLDVKIDCIINLWGETVAIFAGALEPTFEAAVEGAKSHYLVPTTQDNDIVIANAYTKASEPHTALTNAYPAVTRKGGDVVVIANSPSGHVVHYLAGKWGKTIAGRCYQIGSIPPHVNHLIIYTEYPEVSALDGFRELERVQLMSNWSDVIHTLQEFHGNRAKVAVFPSADIQYSI